MRPPLFLLLTLAWALSVSPVLVPPAAAQQHRATRLGDPEGRFAPPLVTPTDLRRLLQDDRLRPDIASILRQAGWTGDVEELRRAAGSAEIRSVKLPPGTRMPFMSSRRNGKPVALIDVLWAGREPIDAYVFDFKSRGRLYRVVTPKICSNFYVVDLGPEPRPSLELTKLLPPLADLCSPIPVQLTLHNRGNAAATAVRVTDALPEGLKSIDGLDLVSFDAGTLAPGASQEFSFAIMAQAPGVYTNRARASSAERWGAEALAITTVRGPVLTLECAAPPEVLANRPAEVCLTLHNTGEAPETKATLALPLPPGTALLSTTEGGQLVDGRVLWELADLAPGTHRRACLVVERRDPGPITFAATARGDCSRQELSIQCETRVAGIPAVLLEVVDLADPVEIGNTVTYEIRVLNQGTAPLTRIRILCSVPDGQEFVNGTGVTPIGAIDRTLTSEALPVLAPKAEATWLINLKAITQGDIRFKVELSGDQFPRAIDEYEATTQY